MSFFAIAHQVYSPHETRHGGDPLRHLVRESLGELRLELQEILDSVETDPTRALRCGFIAEEGCSRTLAPITRGWKLAILISVERATASTLRLCFRAIREDGVPLSCGFEVLRCTSKENGANVSVPREIVRAIELIEDDLQHPPFAQRAVAGELEGIFDAKTTRIGTVVAKSDSTCAEALLPGEIRARATHHEAVSHGPVVFTFAGQRSFSSTQLRWFWRHSPEAAESLRSADEICRRLLGSSLLTLVAADTQEEHDAVAARCPGLVQVGLYLVSALAAKSLIARGLNPDVLMGHSVGEVGALAVGGAYSLDAGVEFVCHRWEALGFEGRDIGGMSSVFAEPAQVQALIDEANLASVSIAVVNYSGQTVVSGSHQDLGVLAQKARAVGISSKALPSQFPFHSSLLSTAVSRFEDAVPRLEVRDLSIPVFSPPEGRFYSKTDDLPRLMSQHLVQPFDFSKAVEAVRSGGGTVFIECGSNVVTPFLRRILATDPEVEIHRVHDTGDAESQLRHVTAKLAESGLCPTPGEPGTIPETESFPSARVEQSRELPIAIVSMGCVLPGATNPEHFFRNILEGESGILDAGRYDSRLAADFKSEGSVVPDKTYTLLGGFVRHLDVECNALGYSREEFARLTRAQRFLALTLGQCLDDLPSSPDPTRTHVYVAATADGIAEYDETLLSADLDRLVNEPGEDRASADGFRCVLAAATGRTEDSLEAVAPYSSYRSVVHRAVGPVSKLLLVDSACSSSLYSTALGVKALRDGECDIAICGGIFGAAPANGCLFSQFQGLSDSGSRPLDVGADGVVFGEGAAFLILKRLPDAVSQGDRIRSVVRSIGLSSDGRSASMAVPRSEGQVIALRRAYEGTGIATDTTQYLEAHATSTPVGDAVEFSSLSQFFGKRSRSVAPIELGSVKSLIGHTGWVAGAASVVKMTKALESRIMPPQSGFQTPNRDIELSSSPFVISTSSKPWPPNVRQEPRRCGINGFGFGGTNAHLILEAFEAEYHLSEWSNAPPYDAPVRSDLVVVGVGALFPFDRSGPRVSGPLKFDRRDFRLPPGVQILPDALEEMDVSQFLALRAAWDALANLGERWKDIREDIGVVIGADGKTDRRLQVNTRIYRDFLRRRLNELGPSSRSSSLAMELFRKIDRVRPSGPYTLLGSMPNLIAGRVANAFGLQGPNFVLSAADVTLLEVLQQAEKFLRSGECKVVLAGSIATSASLRGAGARAVEGSYGTRRQSSEAALVLALTNEEQARACELRTVARLEWREPNAADRTRGWVVGQGGAPYLGCADGSVELADALDETLAGSGPIDVEWTDEKGRSVGTVRAARVEKYTRPRSTEPAASASLAVGRRDILETPIHNYAASLVPVESDSAWTPFSLASRRLLILADQAKYGELIEDAKGSLGFEYTLVCPAGFPVPNALEIQLTSEETIARSLSRVNADGYEAVVAIKDLSGGSDIELLSDEAKGGGLLDLLAACSRHLYPHLQSGATRLGTLCLNGVTNRRAHSYTGLFSGFAKSLARELPDCVIKSLVVDHSDSRTGLTLLEIEFGQKNSPASVDVVFRDGKRYEYRLHRLYEQGESDRAWLGSDAVVLATGGAQGVTAALTEEILIRWGCTVVIVGKTDPEGLPPRYAELDDVTFAELEADFYRVEVQRRPDAVPATLRKQYDGYRRAREVRKNVDRFRKMPGRVEYIRADVTDEDSVDEVVADIASRFGRLDLVVHGAGIQSSRALGRKTIEEFRAVVATKIAGITNLYSACRQQSLQNVHFHLLTSSFSYLGNDGQSDYGAANEALRRLAETCVEKGNTWSSIAWLGWANVGMTRGSEYAALARARGLRAVTPREGRQLFSRVLSGEPPAPANVLLSEGEIAFYDVPMGELSSTVGATADSTATPKKEARAFSAASRRNYQRTWDLSLETHPYLHDHLVRGQPTLPGTFAAEFATQMAHALRPEYFVMEIHNAELSRFVRFHRPQALELRAEAQFVEEQAESTLVEVKLVSDFVHKSGMILQKDIVHFACLVRLMRNKSEIPGYRVEHDGSGGDLVADPYTSVESPVKLDGFFECLSDIELGITTRRGQFRLSKTEKIRLIADFLNPAVLLDALFRFAMIHVDPSGGMPIYVPIRCRSTFVLPGINDWTLHNTARELTLSGTTPWVDGEMIYSDWACARDSQGRTLVTVQGLAGRRVGEVPRIAPESSAKAGVVQNTRARETNSA